MMLIVIQHICQNSGVFVFWLCSVIMTASAVCMFVIMFSLMGMCMSMSHAIMCMFMAVLMIVTAASASTMAMFFIRLNSTKVFLYMRYKFFVLHSFILVIFKI